MSAAENPKREPDENIEAVAIEDQHNHNHHLGIDHRENDDRADEAKGKDADAIDKSYWYSMRFLGTMFAIGTSFMGGIGGKCRSLKTSCDTQSRYRNS